MGLFEKIVHRLQWLTVFGRISISSFDWILNAPLVATFKMFLNLSFNYEIFS